MSKRKTLNIIENRQGVFVSVIRGGGKPNRYKHPTPASLARCRCIVRAQLAAPRAR